MNYQNFHIFLWTVQDVLTYAESKKFRQLDFEFLKKSFLNGEAFRYFPEKSKTLKNEYETNLKRYQTSSVSFASKFDFEEVVQRKLPEYFPLVHQYKGNLASLRRPIISIVGSRRPTLYAREQAHRFAKALAQQGCTILSGGAIGVDAISNATAFENQGSSAVVLGSSLSSYHPSSNSWLFEKISHSDNGIVLSEFKNYGKIEKYYFPKRNISIALLSDFVLIIEAQKKSGSLITAHAALDAGISVGAIPGYIGLSPSEGSNLLIQNGAHCILSPEDVLDCVAAVPKAS